MEDAAHRDRHDNVEAGATVNNVDRGGTEENLENHRQMGRYRQNSHMGEIEEVSSRCSSTRSISSLGSTNEQSDGGSNSSSSKKASSVGATGRLGIMNMWRRVWKETGPSICDVAFEEEFRIRLRNVPHTRFQRFPLKKLQAATHDFAPKMLLWKRECMHRYKGHLDTIGHVVIERFVDVDVVSAKELFFAEVQALACLRHRNIVQGIGWCHEGDEYLVVHELPSKGTLESQLRSSEAILPWDVRYKISLDLAYAILYIHEGYDYCILHRNIQSVNIMLDSDSNAKLTSFYGAKFAEEGITYEAGLITWVTGYTDLEYLESHIFSKASDVFNFGLVLLEIATGPLPHSHGNKYNSLWDLYEKNMLLESVDKKLNGKFNEEEMSRLILMGLLCALPARESRPPMREVVRYLNFEDYVKNSPFRNNSGIESSVRAMAGSHDSGENSIGREYDSQSAGAATSEHLENASSDESEVNLVVDEAGAALSSEAFDIGISSAYSSSGQTNHFQRQIIEGFLSSLDEKLKTGEKFDEIMESVKIFTSAIVAVHAPVDKWNLLVQHILSALKEIESITATYQVDIAYRATRTLSSVRMEMEEHVAVCKEDKKKKTDTNEKLTSRRKKRISLRNKLDNLQKQLVELEGQLKDAEDSCQSLEDEIGIIEERRKRNMDELKHIKLECKIVELYDSMLSKLSLYVCD